MTWTPAAVEPYTSREQLESDVARYGPINVSDRLLATARAGLEDRDLATAAREYHEHYDKVMSATVALTEEQRRIGQRLWERLRAALDGSVQCSGLRGNDSFTGEGNG